MVVVRVPMAAGQLQMEVVLVQVVALCKMGLVFVKPQVVGVEQVVLVLVALLAAQLLLEVMVGMARHLAYREQAFNTQGEVGVAQMATLGSVVVEALRVGLEFMVVAMVGPQRPQQEQLIQGAVEVAVFPV